MSASLLNASLSAGVHCLEIMDLLTRAAAAEPARSERRRTLLQARRAVQAALLILTEPGDVRAALIQLAKAQELIEAVRPELLA